MSKSDISDVGTALVVAFGVVIAFLALTVGGFLYGVLATGFVSVKLWTWFVVPIFGVKALTIAQAYGLALLAGLWCHQNFTNTNKDERETSEKIGHTLGILLSPWIVLLFGWIVHAFLM